jgi:hypothetical protein
MPQSEGESVPPPDPTKTLVRGSDGKLYVIQKNATPVEVDSDDHPDPELRRILKEAEDALIKHFDQLGQNSLASGVKIRITEVF